MSRKRLITIDPGCCKECKRFMKVVLDRLDGTAEPCDMGALRMLMVSYDMYCKASEQLIREGPIVEDRKGRKSPHPAISLTKSYWTQVATYMRELGLTIRAREHIRSLTPEVSDDNPLKNYLQGDGDRG